MTSVGAICSICLRWIDTYMYSLSNNREGDVSNCYIVEEMGIHTNTYVLIFNLWAKKVDNSNTEYQSENVYS